MYSMSFERFGFAFIRSFVRSFVQSLQCALSLVAQCIVIGPVCGFCVCVCVCGSVTTITRKCVHRSSPNLVCRWTYSDLLQLIKFWPSCVLGNGSAVERKFLAPPYHSQRAVFASLWALFFIHICVRQHTAYRTVSLVQWTDRNHKTFIQ